MGIGRDEMLELATLTQEWLVAKGYMGNTNLIIIAVQNVEDRGAAGFIGDQSYMSSMETPTAIQALKLQLTRLTSPSYEEEKTTHEIATPDPSNKSTH